MALRQALQNQFAYSCRSAIAGSGSAHATHTGGNTKPSAARINGRANRHRAEGGGEPG
jgi:hypothetical protein